MTTQLNLMPVLPTFRLVEKATGRSVWQGQCKTWARAFFESGWKDRRKAGVYRLELFEK